MAGKVTFAAGDKVKLVTRTYDVAGELVNEEVKMTVCGGVSRFGPVIVDDTAFNEREDGRWLGQHMKGTKRTIVHEIYKAK